MEQIIFQELILPKLFAKNSSGSIALAGKLLLKKGFVKDSYIDAVTAREKAYPTGLNLTDISIALPHTDPFHVCKTGICIARLSPPIPFLHMGEEPVTVPAELLFLLAIKEPSHHVTLLSRILNALQNPVIVRKFQNATTRATLFAVAKAYLEYDTI